jgi:hypothetical protein
MPREPYSAEWDDAALSVSRGGFADATDERPRTPHPGLGARAHAADSGHADDRKLPLHRSATIAPPAGIRWVMRFNVPPGWPSHYQDGDRVDSTWPAGALRLATGRPDLHTPRDADDVTVACGARSSRSAMSAGQMAEVPAGAGGHEATAYRVCEGDGTPEDGTKK